MDCERGDECTYTEAGMTYWCATCGLCGVFEPDDVVTEIDEED